MDVSSSAALFAVQELKSNAVGHSVWPALRLPLVPQIRAQVRAFEECTLGWQLDIADSCINGRQRGPIYDSGSAELRIVLSYLEMMARMKAGFAGKGQ